MFMDQMRLTLLSLSLSLAVVVVYLIQGIGRCCLGTALTLIVFVFMRPSPTPLYSKQNDLNLYLNGQIAFVMVKLNMFVGVVFL